MKTSIVKITTETNDIPNIVSKNTLSTTLWFSGCHGECKNCQNLNLIVPSDGLTPLNIGIELRMRKDLTDWLVLCGGEPFYNENKFATPAVIQLGKKLGYKIFIYTGYSFDEIREFLEKRNILKDIDYIKCGRYIEELHNKEYQFGSTNQSLYDNKGEKVYYFENNTTINNLK